MREDTAECIANEMMEDLSLSAEEATFIADKIKFEISRMGSEFIDNLSFGQHSQGVEAAGQGTPVPDNACAGPGSHDNTSSELDPAVREAVVANAAAAAVTAFATAAAAANSSGGGAPSPPQLPQPSSGLTPSMSVNRSRSGYGSPSNQSGRPPSYHDLARAMREFHEQQLAAERAAAAAAGQAGDGLIGSYGGIDPQTLVSALEAPLEVRLPNGHALDPAVLAKVAATAATAAASALNEVMPQRNGQQQSPVCTVTSFSNCDQ